MFADSQQGELLHPWSPSGVSRELTYLDLLLWNRPVPVDLEPLSNLTKLQSLRLDAWRDNNAESWCSLSNLSALANLKDLRTPRFVGQSPH